MHLPKPHRGHQLLLISISKAAALNPWGEEPYSLIITVGWLNLLQTLSSGGAKNRAQHRLPAASPLRKAVWYGLISCNSQNAPYYSNTMTWGCSKPAPTLPWAGNYKRTWHNHTHRSHLNPNSPSQWHRTRRGHFSMNSLKRGRA